MRWTPLSQSSGSYDLHGNHASKKDRQYSGAPYKMESLRREQHSIRELSCKYPNKGSFSAFQIIKTTCGDIAVGSLKVQIIFQISILQIYIMCMIAGY